MTQEMTPPGALMKNKRGLVMGLANKSSIAWGLSELAHAHGASLAFSYPSEPFERRVKPLAESLESDLVFRCDVSEEGSVPALFEQLQKHWGSIDFVIHAIAFSDKNQLKGRYVDTTRDNFLNSMNISCFSFTEVAQHASAMMPNGGSLLTMTYHGAQRVMPHYNVMGVAKAALDSSVRYLANDLGPQNIRVNALSAGPIKTLAASGIGDFQYILRWNELNAPLKRNVTLKDIGGAGLYLLSDLSSGVTGEVHHVDSGYHVVGMKRTDAPDIDAISAA